MTSRRFDVAVVGASIAGCAAARLFGLAGARVALLERRPDPDAYKVACTHAILPAGVPAIERLGLAPLLERRGALRTTAEFWSPFGGWVRFPDDVPRGWGVTRRTLDPTLRRLAADTPGVELFAGVRVTGLPTSGGRPVGVQAEDPRGHGLTVHAPLVVGADGRGSTVAQLARVPGRVLPHNRFFSFAYWRGVRPAITTDRLWLLDPDAAAQFPNEDDLTVMVYAAHRSRLAEFRADPEGSYLRALETLPGGPDLSGAERVSKLVGKREVPNVIRPAAAPGVAFVGDAAVASDPLFGTGCSWALQSAEWLADATAPALVADGERGLDAALARYRRRVAWRLGPHHVQIADYASGRKVNGRERMMFRAAAADPAVALAFGEVLGRLRSPLRLLDPRLVPRTARAQVRPAPSSS